MNNEEQDYKNAKAKQQKAGRKKNVMTVISFSLKGVTLAVAVIRKLLKKIRQKATAATITAGKYTKAQYMGAKQKEGKGKAKDNAKAVATATATATVASTTAALYSLEKFTLGMEKLVEGAQKRANESKMKADHKQKMHREVKREFKRQLGR